MNVNNILNSIDLGAIALPEFQRGYVWNRDQVRSLMYSLYRKYPVGSLLVWVTRPESDQVRGDGLLTNGPVRLLLDGQQRITSLYGIIKGRPPQFFEGNVQSFTGLYFHLGDEIFEFFAILKMRDNPLWIDVTELMLTGVAPFITRLLNSGKIDHNNLNMYINRLTAIDNIKQLDFHVEEIAGEDKTIDVVVDIFNRVNSGGTTLSKGDLVLAKIGADWPQARKEMNERLEKWRTAGFSFRLELFLRCINTVLTGNALASALSTVTSREFQHALPRTEAIIDQILQLISVRLGLDHDQVLGSRASLPMLTRYLSVHDGHLSNSVDRDKLLFWYIHTFLWGRYAVSTETVLNQDLTMLANTDNSVDVLIKQLRQNRGDLSLNANDFSGWGRSNRFYPFLYMMTRVGHARDWMTGVDLTQSVIRPQIFLHTIFPKDQLKAENYSRSEANAIANFVFITPETQTFINKRNPEDYLKHVNSKRPGVLESHWIPMKKSLWRIQNYREFLYERQLLLADAANKFLDGLRSGELAEPPGMMNTMATLPRPYIVNTFAEDDRIQQPREFNAWMKANGLPEGEVMYEVGDQTETACIFDLAWPNGIQEGYSESVALFLEDAEDGQGRVTVDKYRIFTDIPALRYYVEHEVLKSDASLR